MNRDDLSETQHLTARIVALETIVRAVLTKDFAETPDPLKALERARDGFKSSAQYQERASDALSDAIWAEVVNNMELTFSAVEARLKRDAGSSV